MSDITYFTLSVEKGLRGNIGKKTVFHTKNGDAIMNVMLFLTANDNTGNTKPCSQFVNVKFPEGAFATLENFNVGDYVRIHFDSVTLAKRDDNHHEEALSISVKANNITLLKKAKQKSVQTAQPNKSTQSQYAQKAAWAA